jgi:hypothetical protein
MKAPAFSTATRSPEQVLSNGHLGARRKVMKNPKPRMKHGLNRANCAALGAVLLMRTYGVTIEQAIGLTGANARYIGAMKWIVAHGDNDLLGRVLHNQLDLVCTARRVRPLVTMKSALARANPADAKDFFKTAEVKDFVTEATPEEHFVATVNAFGVEGTLDRLAAAAETASNEAAA